MPGLYAMMSTARPWHSPRLLWLQWCSELALVVAILFTAWCAWYCWRRCGADLNMTRPLRRLHRDRGASASLEFLLVFFPLLILVLAVWQLAFMLNAQMHVGYAAYAAARSASTVAYMDLPDEPEGVLLNSGEPEASKWLRIERAAIPGTLAISPGNPEAAAAAFVSAQADAGIQDQTPPDFSGLDLAALPGQLALLTAHRGDEVLQGTRISRAAVKALYAERATRVLINGRDASGRLTDGSQAGNAYDLSGAAILEVTVEYDFWLNVPYAGRMMRLAFGGFDALADARHPTLTLRETVAMHAWPRVSAY